ncbi:hypothetical protein [Herpetosiphon gulosus]|uniref:Uncharacterized protein n=1 Tax=Herpetosiphon gulosus TaxID=1973496 RepID=A0ABP9XA97_9CHLR
MATFTNTPATNATHKIIAVDGFIAWVAPIGSINPLADFVVVSYDRFDNTPTLHAEVTAVYTESGMRFSVAAPVLDAATLAMADILAKGAINALMALGFTPDSAQSALRAALG